MVDFGESDKIIKMIGKVDKSNTYNEFTGNILFFIHRNEVILFYIIYIYIYIFADC